MRKGLLLLSGQQVHVAARVATHHKCRAMAWLEVGSWWGRVLPSCTQPQG